MKDRKLETRREGGEEGKKGRREGEKKRSIEEGRR